MENQMQYGPQQPLPNATAVLVLGICSIVFSCFFIGLALGIIGIVLSGKGRKMHRENPGTYSGYGQLNAGFIMSVIGTILSALYLVYWIIVVAVLGGTVWQMERGMQ